MKLYIASLNSGSNGNCYYVGNKKEAVLIDAGISCRTIERRMKNLNLNILAVKAIFISHEHTDHIKGLEVLSKKYEIPVYITKGTLDNSRLQLENKLVNDFESSMNINIGQLSIHPFAKPHDAADPFSFCISAGDVCIGIFTDIGAPTEALRAWFAKCNAAFLEANYDEEMLQNGPYPYYLKQRIMGESGHLSNDNAFELFTKYRSEKLSHLILSHLSAKNNSPEIVENLFRSENSGVNIVVASRHQESPLFEIGGDATTISKQVGGSYSQLYFNFE